MDMTFAETSEKRGKEEGEVPIDRSIDLSASHPDSTNEDIQIRDAESAKPLSLPICLSKLCILHP